MKRLVLACLLTVSSHGWATDLHPECYELYEQFLAADWVNAGRVAGRMHDLQCWPALQGSSGAALQPATDCASLTPHVVQMVNDKADVNGYSILQIADPKPMTPGTIDRVAKGHDIFVSTTMGRVRQPLQHDGRTWYRGKGYSNPRAHYEYGDPVPPLTYSYGNPLLVPNSAPFAANPLTGDTRALNCSGEARFTQGSYLLQMYMDRDSGGQEFIGMAVLMELR